MFFTHHPQQAGGNNLDHGSQSWELPSEVFDDVTEVRAILLP
jgi:hypothetical protein